MNKKHYTLPLMWRMYVATATYHMLRFYLLDKGTNRRDIGKIVITAYYPIFNMLKL